MDKTKEVSRDQIMRACRAMCFYFSSSRKEAIRVFYIGERYSLIPTFKTSFWLPVKCSKIWLQFPPIPVYTSLCCVICHAPSKRRSLFPHLPWTWAGLWLTLINAVKCLWVPKLNLKRNCTVSFHPYHLPPCVLIVFITFYILWGLVICRGPCWPGSDCPPRAG